MAAFNLSKRSRADMISAIPSAREVIELSSDSDSPPPSKRHKSATPLLVDGFVKHAKPASFGDAGNGSTSSGSRQSRAGSDSATHAPVKLHKDLKRGVRDETQRQTPFRHVSQWSTDVGRDSIPRNRSIGSIATQLHVGQQQANAPYRKPESKTPKDAHSFGRPPSASGIKQAPSPQHAAPPAQNGTNRNDDEGDDDDVEILNNFTRPVPPSANVRERPNTGLDTADGGSTAKCSQQLAGVGLPLHPSPAPAVTGRQNQQVFSSPGRSTQFTLEVPLSQDRAPFHLRPDYKLKRRKLLRELKHSTKPAIERPEEVEQYFGQTGFSATYPTGDDGRLLKAASRKARAIERSTVELDWGDLNLPPVEEDAFDMSSLIHPVEQVKAVLTTRFDEQHDPPITFANDINDRRLNDKFQFVNQYIIQPGVKVADPRPELSCDCEGDCRLSTCKCLFKPIDKYQSVPVQTYTLSSDSGQVLLSEAYIINELDPTSGGFEITECNEFCGCGETCWNRVVERGRTAPLEISETAKCGFGVRSSEDIVRGQFIELYLGEVITQQELERRENAKEEGASSYIFSLDFFKGPSQECYHVDGENFGTAMRFVNHSCNPNARSFTVVRSKNDKNVHYVAFFAIRDIKAGEEICIDYQNAGQVSLGDHEEQEGKPSNETIESEDVSDERSRCHCGAANCRKWLWPQRVRKRKKRKLAKHD